MLAYESAAVQWDSFMWAWESELLRPTRKEMSHYGGLPVSYPWEPTHWTDVVTGDAQSASKFYDAGNDVYAFAIHALFPNAESTSRYNSKYLGDVIEGVLGFCWVTRQSTSMGVLLAHASKYVFALKTLLSLESLDKTPDRQRLIEFVSTRSQRNPQQQHVATSSSSTSPAAACSQQQHATPRVRLPKGWFNENERTYLTRLLQHLCPASPPLLSICDEVRQEHSDEATRVTNDAQERVQGPLSSQSADQRTNTAPRTSVVPLIFTMADVPKHRSMQGGSTKSANAKLKEMRRAHATQLGYGAPGFEINITQEPWWRIWLAKAKFDMDLNEIIGDGVTDFLFEALPWTDQNTGQLRTDFTILTRKHRIRLHPQSSGKESLPVFVPHDQGHMPRGTIEQSTTAHRSHLGFSQHDLMSDKEAWRWASEQAAARDLTEDRSFGWERWTCHAAWAKDLTIMNIGIAFADDNQSATPRSHQASPFFWTRATRNEVILHLEIHKRSKTSAYPISEETYKEKFAKLCQRDLTSYY